MTDTHVPADPSDPPALAASVVGAVRTENARLAEIRQRAEAATTSPERSHIWQDARDVPALLALVDELTAQRDLARDAAVALEQELAQQREDIAADFQRMAGNRAPHLSAEENRRASDWNQHAADRIRYPERFSGVAAAVLGLGLQPETSEQ